MANNVIYASFISCPQISSGRKTNIPPANFLFRSRNVLLRSRKRPDIPSPNLSNAHYINTRLHENVDSLSTKFIYFGDNKTTKFISFGDKKKHSPRTSTMALKLYSLFSRTDRTGEIPVPGSRVSMNNDDVFVDTEDLTPLSAMADAFEELSAVLKAKGFENDLDLKTFCDACSLVSILFGALGLAFKFAELEYVSKVKDLADASKSFGTLTNIIDYDNRNDTVKTQGSLSRNLRRVRQGLDLIRALFQNFLSSDDCNLKEAASSAYTKTCAPYHTWAVRTAVYAGMYALPSRDQLLLKLNESGESAEREMIRYINASLPVIEYIDKLYSSRNISLDW